MIIHRLEGKSEIVKAIIGAGNRCQMRSVQIEQENFCRARIQRPHATDKEPVRSECSQVPLPFELTFDPGRIVATHRYGVRAVIKSGGKVLFQSGSATPVITQGNPTQVQLILTQAGG